MKNLKTLFAFFLSGVLFLLAVKVTYGQYGQYGGPAPSVSILIEKMVGKPTVTKGGVLACDTGVDFRDNFSSSDPRFGPEDIVCFRLVVKNTSNIVLPNVTVRDILPAFVEAVEGPGNFDSTSRVVTVDIGDLGVGEERTLFLKTKVVPVSQLNDQPSVFCLVNKADALGRPNPSVANNPFDEDTAQFCVEKQPKVTPTVTPTVTMKAPPQVPSAGPELGVLLLSGNLMALGAGMFLKKLSK